MIKSHYISELSSDMDGTEVTLAGWVNEVRETAKITFLIIRDSTGMVQVIGKRGEVADSIIESLSPPKESVVSIRGIVRANREARIGFEIVPIEIVNLNPLSARIPFELTGKVPAEIDVRLDNREIDLRRREPSSIFRIESTILNTFTDILSREGFEQIRTPCIIAEASEGGSEVFPIRYFEREAYLAQSPQLYKQMAIVGGMERVFMIMPVFRAEKSNTVSHINEITQMDIEMAFATHEDVIKVLIDTVNGILQAVKERNADDLERLGVDLEIPDAKIVTYKEAVEILRGLGSPIETGQDLSRDDERRLYEELGEAVVVKEFPTDIRAFYSMPKEGNPEISNSFDYIYRGIEICSGAQRIHRPEMLIEAIERKGLKSKDFEFYINAFRYGAPPHAGWSIGLERLAMQITGMKNIRECALFPRDRKRLTP